MALPDDDILMLIAVDDGEVWPSRPGQRLVDQRQRRRGQGNRHPLDGSAGGQRKVQHAETANQAFGRLAQRDELLWRGNSASANMPPVAYSPGRGTTIS